MTIAIVRRYTNYSLTAYLLLGWAALLVALPLWPASWWYSLNSIQVLDSRAVDGARLIEVDRVVHRPFLGDWVVEEQVQGPEGWATIERCVGSDYYRPDKAPPSPATVGWWKGRNCWAEPTPAAVGPHRLCTTVKVMPDWAPPKTVHRCSPPFQVQLD